MRPATLAALAALLLAIFLAAAVQLFVLTDRDEDRPDERPSTTAPVTTVPVTTTTALG